MPEAPGLVRIDPAGLVVELLAEDTSLMAAALRSGLRWPSICGGNAECGACLLRIDAADSPQHAPGAAEAARLRTIPRLTPEHRLACQFRPTGRVTVVRTGVRPRPADAPPAT